MAGVTNPLDNPVWSALTGVHADLAEGTGLARRYPADVSPFSGLADQRDPRAWADLAATAGPGAEVVVPALEHTPPGAEVTWRLPGVQLVASEAFTSSRSEQVVELGEHDVDDMLDLVERTRPGPFARRTRLLGTYLGVRGEDGKLLAMAGERLRVGTATEISAVCTDPSARGRGLATTLLRAVAQGVRDRGELPFLHAAATNTGAIGLYEHLGFTLRRTLDFASVRLRAL
ncbi:GNAT family N-acetyltransferase [Kineococcus rhizosphaerae]|uniref:Putative GNAT family acetyltransferase n=1 Tax=Kineococcus rhizosphaerae TaxID=559628 RepID=A0A2T0R1C6_9ACTN|nr:putative GNAT family acetyltransferase [Kineococcus rhizosphaerae]